jgi:hypothetical protein
VLVFFVAVVQCSIISKSTSHSFEQEKKAKKLASSSKSFVRGICTIHTCILYEPYIVATTKNGTTSTTHGNRDAYLSTCVVKKINCAPQIDRMLSRNEKTPTHQSERSYIPNTNKTQQQQQQAQAQAQAHLLYYNNNRTIYFK